MLHQNVLKVLTIKENKQMIIFQDATPEVETVPQLEVATEEAATPDAE